ncbi:MAG: hypothetical protein M0005_14010 [Actinomycetota bacterium]|nr:hypothetical protein [Actinomycetota bacterium]
MSQLVAARPLIRITASEPSIFATNEYLKAVARMNEVLTEGGDRDVAFEEAATAMQMVEIMARREAGMEDLPYEKMALDGRQ